VSAEFLAGIGKLQGREAVGDQIKTIQRLQLQLDRSDGRSDLTSDFVADKYFDFLSACLRTEGGAWTATLGPMEYVGLKISQHISWSIKEEEGQQQQQDESAKIPPSTKVLSLPALLKQMGNCLIDLPSDPSKAPASLRVEAAQLRLQDLSISLTRIACRYALLQEQLQGEAGGGSFGLALACPVDNAHFAYPPMR